MLSSMHSDVIISVEKLSKSFSGNQAVSEITFNVLKGEMFGIVGPDGAGKTTTMRMICGLLTPSEGSISILGEPVKRGGKSTQRYIGYLSQRFSLYGDLSIDENIDFFARIHGRKDYQKEKEELLAMTRLTDFRQRTAERLSGGMKQKLALACSLIHRPEVLILDEPTTGVDPVSRRDFWLILSRLKQSGITIMMATPYLDEAERCDRVAMFHNGKIILSDTPGNLKRNAGFSIFEIVTQEVRKAAAIIKNELQLIPQMFGDRLYIIVPKDFSGDSRILTQLSNSGIEVKSSGYVTASLENIFIQSIEQGSAVG